MFHWLLPVNLSFHNTISTFLEQLISFPFCAKEKETLERTNHFSLIVPREQSVLLVAKRKKKKEMKLNETQRKRQMR